MSSEFPPAAVLVRPRSPAPRNGAGLISALAAMVAVAGVAETAAHGLVQPHIALGFGVLIALGEVARVRLPGERELAPIGVAAALAYALVLDINGSATVHDAWQVAAVTAFAATVGSLPYLAAGMATHLDHVGRRVLLAAGTAALFRPFAETSRSHPTLSVLAMLGAVVAAGILNTLLTSVVRAGGDPARLRSVLRDEVRASGGIGAAIAATGVLIALAARPLGMWALPVFMVPLLVTQFSIRRFATIRATSLQTIRALSRVTEVGGYVEPGHSRRVSTLALALGHELALREADLLDLEYAALMHDIGQLSFTDPIPGGATLVVAPAERRRIAELGADIIRTTGTLPRVADIVERQSDPYRHPGAGADPDLPIASRIIKVANAFDDLVGDRTERATSDAALERLRLGTTGEYDPRVVEALDHVLRRSGIGLAVIG